MITVAGGGAYADKPRPAVVVQSDAFPDTSSVVLCLLTGEDSGAPLIRLGLVPDAVNGLRKPSWIMLDKTTSLPRRNIGQVFGRLSREDQLRLDRALVVFLGIG